MNDFCDVPSVVPPITNEHPTSNPVLALIWSSLSHILGVGQDPIAQWHLVRLFKVKNDHLTLALEVGMQVTEFAIKDPNAYLLSFGQLIAEHS